VSASNAQRRTAGVDARAWNVASIDRVAQGDIRKLSGADVADRSESCQQGDPRILGADQGLARQ
jgi:hypothetical protein